MEKRLSFGGFQSVPLTSKRERIPSGHEQEWGFSYGASYDPDDVKLKIKAIMDDMDRSGTLGGLILDLGSSRFPIVKEQSGIKHRHVVIGVDIGLKNEVERVPMAGYPYPALLVRGDANNNLDEAFDKPELKGFSGEIIWSQTCRYLIPLLCHNC